jgi:arylsulfatase A-like enzyme
MGFQYFYGFMGGESDQWQPFLFRDHTQIFPWIGKPGYNLTTDMADEAIKHMRQLKATAPDQPFFVYYVPGGVIPTPALDRVAKAGLRRHNQPANGPSSITTARGRATPSITCNRAGMAVSQRSRCTT